jgi:hypothetical protein
MNKTLRSVFAALCMAALIVAGGAGASFANSESAYEAALPAENSTSPVWFDALVLRPIGLIVLVDGVILFAPAAAITALTRPQEIGSVFQALVVGPARYVWSDPLGEH